MNSERNIPTLFAVLLLASAAVLALRIARRAQLDRLYWLLLGAGFLYMAADEALQLHETLVKPMRKVLGGGTLGVLYFAWVVPGMAVIVGSAVVFRGFLLRLPRIDGDRIVIAGVTFLSGAVGTELAGGWYFERHGKDLVYAALGTARRITRVRGCDPVRHGPRRLPQKA